MTSSMASVSMVGSRATGRRWRSPRGERRGGARDVKAIRGRQLRRVAGQILWSELGEQGTHYREWFERVLERGYAVGGRDPLASFLTNVRDSPALVRGSRQGFYRLDASRRAAVAQELAEAEAELVDVEQQLRRTRAERDTARVESLRRHRERLAQLVQRLHSRVEELDAVFGGDAAGARTKAGRQPLKAA